METTQQHCPVGSYEQARAIALAKMQESKKMKEDILKLADKHLYEAASILIAGHNSGCKDKQTEDLQKRIAEMRKEIYETLVNGK